MPRPSVLSPRGGPADLADWARRPDPVSQQRVGRRRRPRTARWPRALLRGAALVLAAGALAALGVEAGRWALSSPRFAVTEIEVRGASRLSREEVLRTAGIRPGVNLFRVDPQAAALALGARPEVRRADVVRYVPNRVVITVEERRPFTLVHAGRLHWIDEAGVGLGPEARAVAPGLPVLSGLTPEEMATARQAPSERLARGVALLRLLLRAGHPLLHQISEIDLSRREGPVLYTVEGVEVRLGAEEWEVRIPRLAGVLTQLASSGAAVSSIDLRFRDQVVLKPAGR